MIRGDVGLAIKLEHQGDPASIVSHILLGQAHVEDDARVPSLQGQPTLIVRAGAFRVGEELTFALISHCWFQWVTVR